MKAKRNDPCPCGSGKKYKKCCGLVEAEIKSRKRVFSFGGPTDKVPQSIAKRFIKVLESDDEIKPSDDLPESKASTEEAANPELVPPKGEEK